MGMKFPGEVAGQLRQHLAKTSVVGVVQDTRMEQLSFSQKSCIVFATLTYRCPHLLILDEPTNFLDLESVDSLIAACNKYAGALLLVSHNRDFLRKCAKQYLSVVPGRFNLFDNMKDAERSTYTFIIEMEDGGAVDAQKLVKQNAGGASVHASQDLREKSEDSNTKQAEEGIKVLSVSGSSPSPMPAKKAVPAGVTYVVGEKCQALWTDGKWYDAVVKKVIPETKYQITYTAYGNTVNIEASQCVRFRPRSKYNDLYRVFAYHLSSSTLPPYNTLSSSISSPPSASMSASSWWCVFQTVPNVLMFFSRFFSCFGPSRFHEYVILMSPHLW
jgi:energy-coupling factor transporter ATP-binding protein EcfA2